MTELVCAWCDVYARVEREYRVDYDDGPHTISYTVCAYCGRTELRRGKLGRQTPIPEPSTPPEGFPF
jgi:hypothetical protein